MTMGVIAAAVPQLLTALDDRTDEGKRRFRSELPTALFPETSRHQHDRPESSALLMAMACENGRQQH
jgi:hypothetical protein